VELIFDCKLIGDNVVKDVKPRNMRIIHQTEYLHFISEKCVTTQSVELTDFMITFDDYATLKDHFAILVSRILWNFLEKFLENIQITTSRINKCANNQTS